jgi:hypothetical protein
MGDFLSTLNIALAMPAKKKAKSVTRHDPRKWILRALNTTGKGEAMTTAEILKKASALSGNDIPYYSIYQSLRTLVRRRQLSARRKGREMVFQLGSPTPVARVARRTKTLPMPTTPSFPSGVPVVTEAPTTPANPHNIAPGEIALIQVGPTHIETATNVEGRLVLRKHPRPT